MVVILLIWETCGDPVDQRVQFGKVKMKLGLETKAFRRVSLERTMGAMVRCTSSGCMGVVTRSLFLEDWELAQPHCPGCVVPRNA